MPGYRPLVANAGSPMSPVLKLRKGHAYGTAGFEGALANLNAANQATRLVSDWIAVKDRALPALS